MPPQVIAFNRPTREDPRSIGASFISGFSGSRQKRKKRESEGITSSLAGLKTLAEIEKLQQQAQGFEGEAPTDPLSGQPLFIRFPGGGFKANPLVPKDEISNMQRLALQESGAPQAFTPGQPPQEEEPGFLGQMFQRFIEGPEAQAAQPSAPGIQRGQLPANASIQIPQTGGAQLQTLSPLEMDAQNTMAQIMGSNLPDAEKQARMNGVKQKLAQLRASSGGI